MEEIMPLGDSKYNLVEPSESRKVSLRDSVPHNNSYYNIFVSPGPHRDFYMNIPGDGIINCQEGPTNYAPNARLSFPYTMTAKQVSVPSNIYDSLKKYINEMRSYDSEIHGHDPEEKQDIERRVIRNELCLARRARDQGVDLSEYFEDHENVETHW